MKRNKKELENPYCEFSFFMKHGCNGCKRSKKCEEWYYANRIKRNRNYFIDCNNHMENSSFRKKKQVR